MYIWLMSNKLLLIFSFLGCFLVFKAQNHTDSHVITPHVSPSLRLSENLGQWDPFILFRAQLDGGTMYLEKGGLTFNFYDKKKYRALHHGGARKGLYKDLNIQCHAYKIMFENCNPSALVEKAQQGSDYENFLLATIKANGKAMSEITIRFF